jgi:hypothetical protein
VRTAALLILGVLAHACVWLQSAPVAVADEGIEGAIAACLSAWEEAVGERPLVKQALCSLSVRGNGDVAVDVERRAGRRSGLLVSSLLNYRALYAGGDMYLAATEDEGTFRLGAPALSDGTLVYEIDGVSSYAFIDGFDAYWVRCSSHNGQCRFYSELVSTEITTAAGVQGYCEIFLTFKFPAPEDGRPVSAYMKQILSVSSRFQSKDIDFLMQACT